MNEDASADNQTVGNNSDVWKSFGSDTEAGRLLKKLYCGTEKPKVSYPKVKTKTRDINGPFIPGGGVIGAESRTHQLATKVSDRAIKAPVFGRGIRDRPEVHPIDFLAGRRKPYCQIEKEINEIKRQMDAYRASCIRKKPNQDKEKLQQVFSYSAGTILPRELLPGSELLDRELSHEKTLRVGRQPKNRLEQLEDLYDCVLGEVETRKVYAAEVISLGRPERALTVEKEILERLSELRRLHQLIETERANNHDES